MPKRNVVLTERQEELFETLVKSGRYQNAGEVLRDGLPCRRWAPAFACVDSNINNRLHTTHLSKGRSRVRTIGELQANLNDLSEKVISRTAE
jgi:antitoxin ParD1/3/4